MVIPSLFGRCVYIDANALIYAIEVPQQYPGLRAKVFTPFALGQLTLVTSWVTFAEVLVHPLRLGDSTLEATYPQFFNALPVFEILHVDQRIADEAAILRALHGFKLPDAIHIATGVSAGRTHFVTGDAKWAKAGLQIVDAASL